MLNRRGFLASFASLPLVRKGYKLRPVATDCLANSLSFIPSMVADEQDIAWFNARCGYFDREDSNFADGGVLFFGDSLIDGMDVSPITPYASKRAIGGDTFRGLLNRINRNGAANAIHRAGACVVMIGINDICYGDPAYTVANQNFMLDILAGAMTGKWVVCHILNVGPGNIGAHNGSTSNNDQINQSNAYIDQKFAGNPNVQIVNINPIVAPNGYLLSQYTLDNIHLNRAGCDIWRPAVATALANLSIA